MSFKNIQKWFGKTLSGDAHVDAACGFCGQHRRNVKKLIEGPHSYVCDACVILMVGIIGQDGSPPAVAFVALNSILEGIDRKTPFATFDRLAAAALALATSAAERERLFHRAIPLGHYQAALDALLTIAPEERSGGVLINIVAMYCELERFDEAARALAIASAAPDVDVALVGCHRASIAAGKREFLSADELERALRPALESDHVGYKRSARHWRAVHRAASGELSAALEDAEIIIAMEKTPAALLLKGDLLMSSDLAAANECWREALTLCHPEDIFAARLRKRLAGEHPYR